MPQSDGPKHRAPARTRQSPLRVAADPRNGLARSGAAKPAGAEPESDDEEPEQRVREGRAPRRDAVVAFAVEEEEAVREGEVAGSEDQADHGEHGVARAAEADGEPDVDD